MSKPGSSSPTVGGIEAGKDKRFEKIVPWMAGLLIAITFAIYFLRFAVDKPPGLDELLTYYAVTGQSWDEFWSAMGSGVNYQPCTWFIIPWVAQLVGTPSPFLYRLCSFVFFEAAFILWPVLMRRWLGGITASVLVVAIVGTNLLFPLLVLEGRPYGLYLLVPLICFVLTTRLMEWQSIASKWLLLNLLVQAAMPAVQYVGGFYSAASFAAVILYDLSRKKCRIKLYGSWLAGWFLFGILFIPTFLIQVQRDPFGNWLPLLSVHDMIEFVRTWYVLPWQLFALATVGLVAMYWQKKINISDPQIKVDTQKEPMQFWSISPLAIHAVCWLALPLGLWMASRVGLFNLLAPRYFLPSQIALVAMFGLGWRLLVARISPGTTNVVDTASQKYLAMTVLAVFAGVMLFPLATTLRYSTYGNIAGRVPELADWEGPVVTAAGITFFENHYSYPEGNTYYLLANNAFLKDTFTRFNHRLNSITIDDMATIPRFIFLQSNTERANFDLVQWAIDHGYNLTPWPISHQLIHASILNKTN